MCMHVIVHVLFFQLFQMFDWDQDNVIVTGSTDGIVRVSIRVHVHTVTVMCTHSCMHTTL